MPTEENQLAWLRLGVGYIGPLTMQDHHRQTLRELSSQGQIWTELPYVAQRDANKDEGKRTVYRGLGHTVTLKGPKNSISYSVRHLYIHSSALAEREAERRRAEMAAIEAEIKRIQGLVNKYDYKTPEIIVRRVQQKAFKKRPAQRYFHIQVVEHADRPEAPLELVYAVDYERVARDAELDGVYLLVAGGSATELPDASILQEWKGQYKVEHCFRLTNQLFQLGPVFLGKAFHKHRTLKNPHRIVSLTFLIMVGCLIAGLIERQVRRVLAERARTTGLLAQQQEPIHGLMPEGRDTLKPTIPRILKAFAHYSIVHIKQIDSSLVQRKFAKLDPVQQQILSVLGLPYPAELFGQPVLP
ncbi:hypothetical protein H8E77_10720 [bacterium]|nr:hypothetical protein [bacterium]